MELSDGAKAALSKVVESSATALADAMDSSGKLVKDNVKELAHEIIVFKGYIDHGVAAAFAIAAASGLGWAINWLHTGMSELDKSDRGLIYMATGALTLVMFFMFCWLSDSVMTILKARFAPRLFLTEYAISMLKKEETTTKK